MDTSWQQHQSAGCLSRINAKHPEQPPGTLTYKLWGPKDILELVPSLDLVGDAKVNEFDARVWHVLVQQHDVLWLWGERSWGCGSLWEQPWAPHSGGEDECLKLGEIPSTSRNALTPTPQC